MASEDGDKGGRPTKYKPEFIDQAAHLIKLGSTDLEIAQFFKVDETTLYRWKARHTEFCQSMERTKAQMDALVERSMFQRAVGYSYRAEKVFQHQGVVVRAKTRVHCPPDVSAGKFWLANRQKDRWRFNPEEGDGDDPEAGPGTGLHDPNPDV